MQFGQRGLLSEGAFVIGGFCRGSLNARINGPFFLRPFFGLCILSTGKENKHCSSCFLDDSGKYSLQLAALMDGYLIGFWLNLTRIEVYVISSILVHATN